MRGCLSSRHLKVSLFFFIISVDVYNRMMLRVEESSLLEGFLVGRDKIISLAL